MRKFNFRSDYQSPRSFGGMSMLPPVIRFLLIANVGIFVSELLFGRLHFGGGTLEDYVTSYFALFPIGSPLFHWWQVFTYMFLHDGMMHVLFNMFALWMFGVELEQTWGARRFSIYYALCGLGGALGQLFVAPMFGAMNPMVPTVGASGAIFGILLAFGNFNPDRLIYFYFFIPIKAKYFIGGYVLLELFAVGGSGDHVAHLAHLGGAAMGLLFLLVEDKLPIDEIFNAISGMFKEKPKLRYTPGARIDAKFHDLPAEGEHVSQAVIDQILDKISKSGYQNLSEQEKKILFEASKK